MKNLRLLTLGVALVFGTAYAQTAQDKAEQSVTITQGPTITNITGTSATAKWTTDKVAANQVKFRPVSGGSWKSEFESQGSKDHQVQLTGLQPNTTYEYEIMTRQEHVRTSGQFKTASTVSGTMPDVQGTGGTMAGATNTSSTASTPGHVANANFTPNAPNGRVTLYRAINNTNGAHMLATAQTQIPSGFQQEGVVGYLIGQQAGASVPLYAIYFGNGDSFYTSDAKERAALLAKGGQDFGTIGYIASKQERDTVPLYRMIDANGRHFYTANPTEHAQALQSGMKDEGISGYVWSR